MKLVKLLLAEIHAAVQLMAQLVPAEASELKLILFQNDIDPDADTLMADLTEADFTGYAAVEVDPGQNAMFVDPLSGERVVSFQPLDGPFLFTVSADLEENQTIHGFALVNQAKTVLYAAERLETPVVLTVADEAVEVAAVNLRFSPDFGNA